MTYSIILTACPSFGLLLTTLLATLQVREPAWYLFAIFASYTPTAWLAHLRLRNLGSEHRQMSSLLHDALHFGGWVTVGSLAYVLFQRIDVFILAGLDPGPDVGTYGAAARFASIAAVFGSTITTVLMPTGSKSSTWATPSARGSYLAESTVSIGLTGIALGLGILMAPYLVRTVFGPAYAGATGPTRVLLLSQLLLITQMPFYFAFYGLKGERWIAGLGLGQLAVAGLAGYLLTARYGMSGAAWSNVATYALGLPVIGLFLVIRACGDRR